MAHKIKNKAKDEALVIDEIPENEEVRKMDIEEEKDTTDFSWKNYLKPTHLK